MNSKRFGKILLAVLLCTSSLLHLSIHQVSAATTVEQIPEFTILALGMI